MLGGCCFQNLEDARQHTAKLFPLSLPSALFNHNLYDLLYCFLFCDSWNLNGWMIHVQRLHIFEQILKTNRKGILLVGFAMVFARPLLETHCYTNGDKWLVQRPRIRHKANEMSELQTLTDSFDSSSAAVACKRQIVGWHNQKQAMPFNDRYACPYVFAAATFSMSITE